jgi:hypothetical protein
LKRKAKKDIKCFKVVYYEEGIIRSPYQHFIYDLNKIYVEYPLTVVNKDCWYWFPRGYCVYRGFHSYSTKCEVSPVSGTVFFLIKENHMRYGNGFHILECEIPKGTIYYQNKYGEIVSEAIKPIKVWGFEEWKKEQSE